MTPTMGTIISPYVGSRIIELLLQSNTHHSSEFVRVIVLVAGVVARSVYNTVVLDDWNFGE